jgi:hypothetical protein
MFFLTQRRSEVQHCWIGATWRTDDRLMIMAGSPSHSHLLSQRVSVAQAAWETGSKKEETTIDKVKGERYHLISFPVR